MDTKKKKCVVLEMKIKIFESIDHKFLEEEVNRWLEDRSLKIIDTHYNYRDGVFSVMIVYETEEPFFQQTTIKTTQEVYVC